MGVKGKPTAGQASRGEIRGDPTDVDAKTMKSFESWDCVGSVCAKDARWHSAARPATISGEIRPGRSDRR